MPCPDVSPESLGIEMEKLDKNVLLTQTQAGEMYSKLGGSCPIASVRRIVANPNNVSVGNLRNSVDSTAMGAAAKTLYARIAHCQLRMK